MATEKPRINITADPAMHKAITAAARREGVPVATKAAELLAIALELEEDIYFGGVALERLKKKGAKYIALEDVK